MIFFDFFGQKICTYQKNVLPLHRQIKNKSKTTQFATIENDHQKRNDNSKRLQNGCKDNTKFRHKQVNQQ